MKLYSLSSKLDFGEYSGKTLKEVFIKDPEYIEECILENPSFCFNPSNIDSLEDMNADFVFSEEAVEKLEEKYDIYEEEENDIDEMDSFSDEDLKNLGIMGDGMDDDDFDDFGGDGGFYDDNYGY
jgi:hypothetical protein